MANVHLRGPYRSQPLVVRLVKKTTAIVLGTAFVGAVLAVPFALLYLAVKVIAMAWGG